MITSKMAVIDPAATDFIEPGKDWQLIMGSQLFDLISNW